MGKEITKVEVLPPEESGREKAKRILHIADSVDKLTTGQLLQYIFDLAKEVKDEDPKNAISFRVAIDAMQYLYKEIQNAPPAPVDEEDRSEEFLKKWEIK